VNIFLNLEKIPARRRESGRDFWGNSSGRACCQSVFSFVYINNEVLTLCLMCLCYCHGHYTLRLTDWVSLSNIFVTDFLCHKWCVSHLLTFESDKIRFISEFHDLLDRNYYLMFIWNDMMMKPKYVKTRLVQLTCLKIFIFFSGAVSIKYSCLFSLYKAWTNKSYNYMFASSPAS
jgi:hypothetical protein